MIVQPKKSKLVIIGAGNVGTSIAYTAMLSSLAAEIVLIDANANKARGESLDMNHGIAYHKQITIRDGDYSDCADASIIIITAGVNRKPGQTRLDLARINVSIAKDIAYNIMKHATNPLLLVVANPVDILTYVFKKETGLDKGRVIGTGTTLDTARFRYLISSHCNVDVKNVHGYILGEHGDSSVPIWSRTNIAGKPFDVYCDDCDVHCQNLNREKIFLDTQSSGAEIISLKGATYYGIAMATGRIISAILGNEFSVLPVSSVIEGVYGINDVALSMPSILCYEGIDRIFNIHLSEKEEQLLVLSAQKLKEVIKEVY